MDVSICFSCHGDTKCLLHSWQSLYQVVVEGRIAVWLKITDHSPYPDKSGNLHEEIIHLNVVGSVLTLQHTNGLRPGEL